MSMKSLYAVAFAAVGVFGSLSVSAVVIDNKPVVTRGVWNSNFDAVLAFAKSSHVPMVLYHGRTSCPHCVELKSALGKPDFIAWQEQRQFAMCLNLDKKSGAKPFSATGASFPSGEAQSLNTVPRISVYWLKPDGEEVHVSFRGGSASFMPVKGANLEMSVADSVDAVLAAAGYVDETPTAFRCGDVEGNRLEAEPMTEYVDVQVVRRAEGLSATEWLQVDYPGGSDPAVMAIDWAVGETEKSIRVPTPWAEDGSRIRLTLVDGDGTAVAVSGITYVNREVGSANPLWIGERTVETLEPGEWTMDFGLATAAAAGRPDEAFTLALVEGALWNSNTALLAAHVLDRADFRDWARARNVYLAAIDVPESAGGVCLLSQGGAGYMSRKMIDAGKAQEVMGRNAELAAGLLRRPESGRSDRPDVPVLVLLDKAGAVRGRIELFASSAPLSAAAGYLARMDELLAAAGDPEEERNAHWLTAVQEVPSDGSFSGTVSGGDVCDVVRLSGVPSDALQRADVLFRGGDAEQVCELSLVELRPETATVVASVSGRIGDGLSLSAPVLTKSAAYCLRLRMTGLPADAAAFGAPSDSTVGYEVKLAHEPLVAAGGSGIGASPAFSASVPLTAGIDPVARTAVVGLLSVSGSASGKVSAKFSGTESKAVSFSGRWQAVDADGGLHALLTARGGERLYLIRASDGRVTGFLADAADAVFVGSERGDAAGSLEDLAGVYNVAFESDGGSAELAGHAYLQMKFTSASALKKGRASVSGLMPDGKAFSCKAFVRREPGGRAKVTLFKRVSSGAFSAAFAMERPDVPCAIGALPEISSAFVSVAKGRDPEVMTYRVRGCAFPADLKPAELCERFDVGPDLTVSVADDLIVTVAAGGRNFVSQSGEKVSYAVRTGIFSGKVDVLQAAGRLTSAAYRCMFVPGWGGPKGSPVGFGTLYYRDKAGRTSVMRSKPVELR